MSMLARESPRLLFEMAMALAWKEGTYVHDQSVSIHSPSHSLPSSNQTPQSLSATYNFLRHIRVNVDKIDG